MLDETWSPQEGDPAIDAVDVPKFRDGRYMKKVILVCPECGTAGVFIELPDTTLRCGDETDECHECGFGL